MELPINANECYKCVKRVTSRQQAFERDVCCRWVHRTCGTRFTYSQYVDINRMIRNGNPFNWTCEVCTAAKPVPVTESTRLDESPSVTQHGYVHVAYKVVGVVLYYVTADITAQLFAVAYELSRLYADRRTK